MKTTMHCSRRAFIKAASGLTVATELMSMNHLFAAEKMPRWTIACRDVHLKATGKPDCWSALKELGIRGVEVVITEDLACPSLFHPSKTYRLATAEGIQALRSDLEEQGAVITALCMANRLEERLDQEVAWMKTAVNAALKLNIKAIRIDVVPRSMSTDQFLPFAVQACKRLCDIVQGTSIRLGIENHGQFTNDPHVLEKLFTEVGSAHLGLTFDPANLYWFGHPLDDVYTIGKQFAARAVHTHCKNIKYPEDKKNSRRSIGWEYGKYACPLYLGDIDYQKVAGLLRAAEYSGDLCLENECLGQFPAAQHVEILQKEVAALKGVAS